MLSAHASKKNVMGVRELDGASYWQGVEEAAPAAQRNAISG